jgi:integrase
LPRALKPSEADRLLKSFASLRRSPKRGYAIVHCALDMGLRAGEIAHLMISDIDWTTGTVTLRGTKSLRHDILPLRWKLGRRWPTICNMNAHSPVIQRSSSDA